MSRKINLEALGIFIGMVIGAGFFSLPYSIVKSGILWGVINFLIASYLVYLTHILYSYISFNFSDKHRFTAYVKILLGNKAEKLALFNIFFVYYGTFLVYAVLGGFFLFNIFNYTSSFNWSLVFLFMSGISIFTSLKNIGKINFYLSIPLMLSIIAVFLYFYKNIKLSNFGTIDFVNPYFFYPYGIFIFSLSGFSVIPEIADFFKNKKGFLNLKFNLKLGQIIISIFYIIFIITIIGSFGSGLKENLLTNLKELPSKSIFYLISIIGFLAVFTSAIALLSDFKNILRLDYKFSARLCFLLYIVPLIIFIYAINEKLSTLISFIGAAGLGIFSVLILLMAEKLYKKFKNGNINKQSRGDISYPFRSIWTTRLIISLIILGAAYELFLIFKKG